MSTHKHIDKICLVAALLAIVLCALFMNGEAFGLQAVSKVMGYESRLFDTSKVHTIDIVMDDWDSFIENCENEEYAACSLVIDGENYGDVGIRAKGNTSLSTVASMNSDRYSFKIEFDQYDSTKSYHGLDKLSLNNLIQDSTMMKDYLTYQMMREFGAAAPLCSYAYITVNGEDWGLYLAVEAIEDSFLQRNYSSDYGDLYKPDSMDFGGGRGNGKDFNMEDFDFSQMENFRGQNRTENRSPAENGKQNEINQESQNQSQMQGRPASTTEGANMELPEGFDPSSLPQNGGMQMPEGFDPSAMFGEGQRDFEPPAMPNGNQPGGMGGGGRGMGSSETKLQYIDDDPDSYSTIFSSAKTAVTDADQTRLIQSLKTLSEGEDIESVLDMDQLLRYFVVHNFVVNGDSYTGSMIHNYYLYEENGKLSMLPWDYNLAFGTFQGQDAGSAVNDPIDTPLSVSGSGDRPIVDWIFSSEKYTQLYHQYFAEFLETVDVAAMIDEASALIAPYVEKDPSKFYTTEAFNAGVTALREFCILREESVQGQLGGTIPSTDDGQATDNSTLIDASSLTLSDMGSMGMGGGRGGNVPGGRSNRENDQRVEDQSTPSGDTPTVETIPVPSADGTIGNPLESFDRTPTTPESSETQTSTNRPEEMMRPESMGNQMAGGERFPFSGGMNADKQAVSNESTAVLLAVSVAVLLVGLVIAKKYRH